MRRLWQYIKSVGAVSIPIYCTRPAGDGVIGSWSVGGWFALVMALLFCVNVLLWGIAGIVVAIGVLL